MNIHRLTESTIELATRVEDLQSRMNKLLQLSNELINRIPPQEVNNNKTVIHHVQEQNAI